MASFSASGLGVFQENPVGLLDLGPAGLLIGAKLNACDFLVVVV
jgi:hypothetical protein